MAADLTLDEFLSQLASQRGLHRKIRLLARYWRQVQSLPPAGRERVALALGSRAAWNRLEALFNRDGTLSEGELAVKQALESVGRADPGELRALARRVRAGDYAGIGKDLVDVVGKALDEEAAAADPGAEATGAGTAEAEPGAEATGAGTAEAEPGAAATEPEIAVTEPGIVAAEPGIDAAEPEVAENEREAESVDLDELAAEIEFDLEARADEFSSTAFPDRFVPAQPEVSAPEDRGPSAARVKPSQEPASAVEAPWPEHPPEVVTLSARECLAELRRLHDQVGYGAGLGSDGRSWLLRQLGSGWAGRRGLSQLIRSGSIRDVDEALQLIDRLETPVQRSWCLGDLVEHWDLGEVEAARVLDAAPSPAARRRLQRRVEKRYRAQ